MMSAAPVMIFAVEATPPTTASVVALDPVSSRGPQPKLTTPLACTPFRESVYESPAVMNQWSKLS